MLYVHPTYPGGYTRRSTIPSRIPLSLLTPQGGLFPAGFPPRLPTQGGILYGTHTEKHTGKHTGLYSPTNPPREAYWAIYTVIHTQRGILGYIHGYTHPGRHILGYTLPYTHPGRHILGYTPPEVYPGVHTGICLLCVYGVYIRHMPPCGCQRGTMRRI